MQALTYGSAICTLWMNDQFKPNLTLALVLAGVFGGLGDRLLTEVAAALTADKLGKLA